MHSLLILLALAAVVLGFALFISARSAGHQFTPLANVAEGIWAGPKTYLSSAAIATTGLLVAPGADAAHVAIAGVGDIPLGFVTDQAAAAEDSVTVNVLGITDSGQLGIASAAIALGDMLVAAANGKLRTLPAAAGTYYIVGRALDAAAADGDLVAVAPCFPTQRVVA